MKMAYPWLLHLFWLIPGLTLLYYAAGKSRKRQLALFGELELLSRSSIDLGQRRFRTTAVLVVLGVFFLVLAAIGPLVGSRPRPVGHGLDLVIALDVSKSMLAQDLKPNRIERAKLAIQELILQLDGDAVGLVVFAGTGFVQAPLTRDYDALLALLQRIDTDMVPVGGTNLQQAIEKAREAFRYGSGDKQVLIIVSDGENHVGEPVAAAKEAAAEGIQVFTLGVGTPEGELIPIEEQGVVTYLKDSTGRIVRTRLDEETLQAVATAGGGQYYHALRGDFGLMRIYEEQVKAQREQGGPETMEPINRYQIPLLVAVLLLGLEVMVAKGRR
ncbi:MAG TPA: VWA domain-containing protein [Firmicutes bacterium]|nr:VWA domain-containing protein [Bacillota bacterium]